MLNMVSIWLLVAALAGAGLFNAIGRRATRDGFVRWGFPAWWGHVTGGMEILAAVLIALPVARAFGLILGAAILAAALLTVLRHRDYKHLPPIGLFVVLMGLAAFSA